MSDGIVKDQIIKLMERAAETDQHIADLQSRVRDLEGKPATPIPVRFERPCFDVTEADPHKPKDCKTYTHCSCGIKASGGDWETCAYGGRSPHLAEYRGEKPAPGRAWELRRKGICPVCEGEKDSGFSGEPCQECDGTGKVPPEEPPTPPPSPAPAAGTCGSCPLFVLAPVIQGGCQPFCKNINSGVEGGQQNECPARTRWREAEARAKGFEEDAFAFSSKITYLEERNGMLEDYLKEAKAELAKSEAYGKHMGECYERWQSAAMGERERVAKMCTEHELHITAAQIRALPPPEVMP